MDHKVKKVDWFVKCWRWAVLNLPAWVGLRKLYSDAFEDGRNGQWEFSLRGQLEK